ncbi:FAD:protein FMN transferase [Pseudomonas sp. SCB32]|uniref:FAD:protein FMN transferase n=1 Tax=Pseudomonas sp. SCB32 TaxID=2653853 RepID=UPI001264DBEF|nr:FAD:protein FMN transferase [Pseudomonas sp. SCB32]
MKTCSESRSAGRYDLNGATMGTRYRVLFYSFDAPDLEALAEQLNMAVTRVDQQMSNWRPDSELMRFNDLQPGIWMTLPAELLWVLHTAIQVGVESAGAFDIAVGDLVGAWGFGPTGRPADDGQRDALRRQPRASAMTALEFDFGGGRVRKRHPVHLDLSGIAKGFGVDQLARCLEDRGIHDYLVSIDGEFRARGGKPGDQPWTVAIERPEAGVRTALGALQMGDGGLATSGDYRHFHEHEGKRYAHTMDPRRAAPLDNGIASVSVLAPTCMLADAWATALMVLGPTLGPAVAREQGLSALFLLREDAGLRQLWVEAGRF